MNWHSTKEPMNILLLEDDTGVTEVMCAIFDSEGHRHREVTDGRKGMELLEGWQPDLIITDIAMPEMDGLEFLSRYYERFGQRTPILVCAASSQHRTAALSLGAYDF